MNGYGITGSNRQWFSLTRFWWREDQLTDGQVSGARNPRRFGKFSFGATDLWNERSIHSQDFIIPLGGEAGKKAKGGILFCSARNPILLIWLLFVNSCESTFCLAAFARLLVRPLRRRQLAIMTVFRTPIRMLLLFFWRPFLVFGRWDERGQEFRRIWIDKYGNFR